MDDAPLEYRVSKKMPIAKLWSLFFEVRTKSINYYYLTKVYHDICSSAKRRMKILKLVISVAKNQHQNSDLPMFCMIYTLNVEELVS